MRIMRTSSGVARRRTEVRIVLMQPDLPEPVVPAMSTCGMRARSVHTALPEMSLPSQTESGLAACRLLAGNRRQDPDFRRRERVREVVLQRGDLRDLGARRELELVARHARAGDLAADLRLDAEVG